MLRYRIFWSAVVLAVAQCLLAGEKLQTGEGSFVFVDQKGNPKKPVTVWYFRPEAWRTSDPILIVMHGMKRNGQAYREPWEPIATQHRALLIVPEFSTNLYSSMAYNQGGVGVEKDPAKWSFTLVENLFDHIRAATGATQTNYLLYGHSAGGQFVHRFVEFMPQARYKKAVAANPGYYTMPTFEKTYPYGFKESPMTEAQLEKVFTRPLTILLGEQDIDPNAPDLHRSPGAMEQGRFRLERGRNFFAAAQKLAQEKNWSFNWKMQTVPSIGHSNAGMTPAAAKVLFEK